MSQTGAQKSSRGKSGRQQTQGTLSSTGEQLALALEATAPAAASSVNPADSSAAMTVGTVRRRRIDDRGVDLQGHDESTPADARVLEADWASAPDPTQEILLAQASGAASGQTNDAPAGGVPGSSSNAGAAPASGSSPSELFDLSGSIPAFVAFGVGALLVKESSSSSSAVPAANQAPTSTPIAAATASERVPFSVDISGFSDPEQGKLTYSFSVKKNGVAYDASAWLSIDPVTRKLAGTPPEGEQGVFEVTVTATDSASASKSEKFTLTVQNGDAPVNIDGYLKGALVFRDLNNNGVWDHDPINTVQVTQSAAGAYTVVINNGAAFTAEPWGITDAFGQSPGIGGGNGNLRTEAWTYGGTIAGGTETLRTIDISTQREWSGSYTSPAGSNVINPITTLVTAARQLPGVSVDDALARVKTVLNLPNTTSLLNYDPLAEASKASDFAAAEQAMKVQAKALQVANILRVAAEVAAAAGVTDDSLVSSAIARELVKNAAEVNLGSEATLRAVFTSIKASVSVEAAKGIEAAASVVAKSIAVLNNSIQSAIDNSIAAAGGNFGNLDIGGALTKAVQYQIVAQELVAQSAAKAVATAIASGGSTSGLADILSGLEGVASGTPEALSRAISLTRASVGTLFVSSNDTKGASAIDDNLFVLTSGTAASFSGAVSGNALANDVVPRNFTAGLWGARTGDEVLLVNQYQTNFTGNPSKLVLTGTYGTLDIQPTGAYTYKVTQWPGTDAIVQDTFSYRLAANGSGSLSDELRYDFGTVRVSVSTFNFPPLVNLLQGQVIERGTANPLAPDIISFNLVDAGRDPEGSALRINSVSFKPAVGNAATLNLTVDDAFIEGQFGRLTRIDQTNVFEYKLDQDKADFLRSGETEVDVFKFSLVDAAGKSTDSSIVITIVGTDDPVLTVNVAPTTADKTLLTTEDTAYRFALADFAFRDRNVGDTLSKVVIDTLPLSSAGTLLYNAQAVTAGQEILAADIDGTNGKLTFVPALNVNGLSAASFKFKVVDSKGVASAATGTISFDVSAVNDAPVAVADTVSATEDMVATFTAAQLLGNDTDPDLDPVTIKSVTAVTGGAVVFQNGSVGFTPTANFNGAASFTYIATDGKLDSAATTVTINVAAVNDAPVNTVPTARTVAEDTDLSVTGLSIADVDATGSMTVTLAVTQGKITVASAAGVTAAAGTNGTASVTLTGTVAAINSALSATNGVVYKGKLNYNGPDTLTMTTSDGGSTGTGGALTDTDTVGITVTAVNDPPVFLSTVPKQLSRAEAVRGAQSPPAHGSLVKASSFVEDVENDVLKYSIVDPANAPAGVNAALGVDGGDFVIDINTGELSFDRDLDDNGTNEHTVSFESHRDANNDGVYLVIVRVYHEASNTENFLYLEVSVTNEDEPGIGIIRRGNDALTAAPRQGDTLVAALDEPDDEGAISGYEWFADGVKIAGAQTSQLVLTESLIGRKISFKVTYDDFGSFDGGQPDSVTSDPTLAVLPANTAPKLVATSSLSPISYTLGSQAISIPVASRFADPDIGDVLSYSLRDSTGAPLAAGLTINAAGVIGGSPTADWLGATRTILVTATDTSGASATDAVTVTVTAAASGLYVRNLSAQMTDYDAKSGSVAATAYRGAVGTQLASGRIAALFSSTTDGVGMGSDVSRANLLQLLDSDPLTGTVPFVSLPIASTLTNGTLYGRMALTLAMEGLPEVSVDLAVRMETASGVTTIKVHGAQAPNSLVSFADGVVLGKTGGDAARPVLDFDLLRLLDQGLSTSAKGLLAQVISDDLDARFSLTFSGLPIYDVNGASLAGLDVSVAIDDTPNRAPSITMPHSDSSKLAISLPVGSTIGLGALLGDINSDLSAAGDLFNDAVSDPNAGDILHFLVSKPTSGSLVWKGDVVVFPSAGGTLPSGFKESGGSVWLMVAASEVGRLEYRANPSIAAATSTAQAEAAGLMVAVMDQAGAMSAPAAVAITVSGATVPSVLGLVGDQDKLIDLSAQVAGIAAGAVLPSGATARVMAVPTNGVLYKASGTTLAEVKVGDTLAHTDTIRFDPVNSLSATTPVRDDLILRQHDSNGVSFRRVDFSLAVAAPDAIPTSLTLTPSGASVAEGTLIAQDLVVASVSVGGSSTVNYTLTGADAGLFKLTSDTSGTKLVMLGGVTTPDFEKKKAYAVRVNADNPNVGIAGSVETSQDFTVSVTNAPDTLELRRNAITLTDYDVNGVARPATVLGAISSSAGRNTLGFDAAAAGVGFTRANLVKLFDTTPGNGKAPTVSFDLDLQNPGLIPSGSVQLNVALEARSGALGNALPMTVTFPVTVNLVSQNGVISFGLPTQTTTMSLAVGSMSLGSLKLGNLDSDFFQVSNTGTSVTPSSLSIKLDSLFSKAEADKVSLASLGQGGAVGFAGVVAAAALGDKKLSDLVALARDVTTLSPDVADTPLGRIVEILKDTVTVPTSLSTMKFSEALRLGAKLVLPDNLGGATLREAVGLGFKVLDLPPTLSTAGSLLKVMRDAIDLPSSLEGTLGTLKGKLATTSSELQLLENIETLTRAVLGTSTTPYSLSLADKTIPQLLDMIVASGLGSMKLSDISSKVEQSFGGYKVPQVLSLASDIAENLYGPMSLNTMLTKANSAITLPASSSSLGGQTLSQLLDIAQALVVLGDMLQGGSTELAALTGGSTTVAALVNLVQSAVTVDGKISGRSLGNLLALMDSTFKVSEALGTGNSLTELVNDLRNDMVDLDTMVHLASRAVFSDNGELSLRVDLPDAMGLLSADDTVIHSLAFKAALAAAPNSAPSLVVPGGTPSTAIDPVGPTFNFGKFLLGGSQSGGDAGDTVKGIWVTNPATGSFTFNGKTLLAGEQAFVPLGSGTPTVQDLEDLVFSSGTAATGTSIPISYIVEDSRGALSPPTTYNYSVI